MAVLRTLQNVSVPLVRRTLFTRADPVKLSYDLIEPRSVSAPGQSLVVAHGLFGSKQNWRSLAKAFAQRLGMPVYTLDMRNHGASPHAEPHTYAAMAIDIAEFLKQHGLTSGVNLVGHSMGGKTVMALALNPELNSPLRSLISVDIAPVKGRLTPEFKAYIGSMLEIEHAKVKSKSEADHILAKVEPLLSTRQFLLTNARSSHGHLTFRVPLDILSAAIPALGDFPYTPEEAHWDGPVLLLKGEHSKYINNHNLPVAKECFPNMRLETLDAGHWVHAEQPAETVRIIQEFVESIKA